MLALKITDQKNFTNKLFLGDTFDLFWLNQAEIITSNVFFHWWYSFFRWLALSGADAPAPPKGEPLAKPESLPYCQGLSLWERWHSVSCDGEGEDVCLTASP